MNCPLKDDGLVVVEMRQGTELSHDHSRVEARIPTHRGHLGGPL